MKIKMLSLMAGPGGVRKPGQIFDLPPVEAEVLIAGGYAEKLAAPVETPVVESAPRVADKPAGRKGAKQETDKDTQA